jgi:arabinogalactan endo-1,4-beta-galactosidase
MSIERLITYAPIWLLACLFCCSSSDEETVEEPQVEPPSKDFYFGADLSYVNQLLDRGAVFKDGGATADPYELFSDRGTNLVRLRLWHNPVWTKEVYGEEGVQLYNDLKDVERAISKAKAANMKVLLDFHFSDTWADPAHQNIPAAWMNIESLTVLQDSVYNYTFKSLQYLSQKGLLPEFVQIGNETNCGMMYSNASVNFPKLNVCDNNWTNAGKVINSGIKAVRDVTANTSIKTKIILHVADPKNIQWWFDGMTGAGNVSDFDIIGFSYYPLWHTTVSIPALSDRIKEFTSRFKKDVMIVETAYPWTTAADDSYGNHFGTEPAIAGYPKTTQGQYDIMVKLTREVKDGGGIGIIYWEPAWISADMKDLWGTGSSWENCAFFDFEGNPQKVFDYMKLQY